MTFDDVKCAKAQRKKAERAFMKNRTDENRNQYRKYRNQVNLII